MKLDSIIFDLDGTLWDSTNSVLESWNATLDNFGKVKSKLSIEDMQSAMGLVIDDIAEMFFPYLDDNYRLDIVKECCKEECKHLNKNGAVLYENLEETLITLSNKYKLFIVSNCQDGYIESFLDYHKLSKYFIDYECIGRSGLPKGENIKQIIKRNNLVNSVYVGDTVGDLKAARFAGVPFIYSSYGFGDVNEFDYKIDKLSDVVKVVDQN